MKGTLLLTHSYFLAFDPKQKTIGRPYAPLGTLYAASVLRHHGYPVALFDTMFVDGPGQIETALRQHRPRYFVIYDDGFNYLTKMCLTNMREAAFRMVAIAREYGCRTIVAGSDSSDRYEMYLASGVDFVLVGEAEATLVELVDALDNGQEAFEAIDGLAFRSGEAVRKTRPREVIRNLDGIPFPAWDLIDLDPYRKSWMKHAGYFSINMATTRGCPFKCNWCAKPIYGNRYHSRSPENVVAELVWLKEKVGLDHVWFCDDIFGLKPGWVSKFSALLGKERVSFRFKIQARADLLIQESNIRDLARSGCEEIWMGAESGSQKILDAMDKGITLQQVEEATRLLKKHKIKPCFFIQFGYPGETKADIEKTIAMINRLLPDQIGISVSYPLPGTRFYEKVKAGLDGKSNWKHSDEMALLFTNTYQPAFYKQLHAYVHKRYKQEMSINSLKLLLRHPFQSNAAVLRKALSGIYYVPATSIEKRKLNQLEKQEASNAIQ